MTDIIFTLNSQNYSTVNTLGKTKDDDLQMSLTKYDPLIRFLQSMRLLQNGYTADEAKSYFVMDDVAIKGDLEGIMRHMEKEGYIPLSYGRALFVAAREGHHEIVKYLTETDKPVREERYKDIPIAELLRKQEGFYAREAKEAFYCALIANRIQVVEYFLQQRIGEFTQVLGRAATMGNLEMVRYLVERLSNFTHIKKGALEGASYEAVLKGSLDILKLLCSHGVNIHVMHKAPYGCGASDENLLTAASRLGNLEIVKYLVKQGADIHAENEAALRIAVKKERLGIIKFLVEKGVGINSRLYKYDPYLLSVASRLGNLEIVKYLVKQGADIHAENEEALHIAIKEEHLDIIKFLVEQGADVNAPLYERPYIRQEDRALSIACRLCNLEIVKYLIEQGADIHGQNEAALDEAAKSGCLDIIKFLVDKGANIRTCKKSVLQDGCACNPEFAKYLAEQGVDIYTQDRQGMPERRAI